MARNHSSGLGRRRASASSLRAPSKRATGRQTLTGVGKSFAFAHPGDLCQNKGLSRQHKQQLSITISFTCSIPKMQATRQLFQTLFQTCSRPRKSISPSPRCEWGRWEHFPFSQAGAITSPCFCTYLLGFGHCSAN